MKLSIRLAVLLVAAPFTSPALSQTAIDCASDSSGTGRIHSSAPRGYQMQGQRDTGSIEVLTAGEEQLKNATPASRVAMLRKAREEERLEAEAKLDELFKQLVLQQKLAEREQSRDAELQALLESEKDEASFLASPGGLNEIPTISKRRHVQIPPLKQRATIP